MLRLIFASCYYCFSIELKEADSSSLIMSGFKYSLREVGVRIFLDVLILLIRGAIFHTLRSCVFMEIIQNWDSEMLLSLENEFQGYDFNMF